LIGIPKQQRQQEQEVDDFQRQQSSSSSSLPPQQVGLQDDDDDDSDINDDNKTVLHVMQSSIETLKMAKIDESEESVYHLLAFVLNLSWETGFRDLRQVQLLHSSSSSSSSSDDLSQRQLTGEEFLTFQYMLHRRLQHEPIQYLVGQWDFLHHVFTIEPPLLCPRPETEELVLLAMQDVQTMLQQRQQQQQQQQSEPEPLRILDVGCGTGCIGISLLAASSAASTSAAAAPHPACQVVALDVEERAIAVATLNAQRILGNCSSDCYQAIISSAADYDVEEKNHHGFDLIISNPPYIPQADMDTLDDTVFNYESHQALFGGGADGMNIIRDIVRKLPQWCRQPPGSAGDAICWMEVDPTHPKLLQEWLASSPSLRVEYVQTEKDLQGKDRFVKLRVKSSQEKEDSSIMI
jgi:release factor glutamine methyltransferase